MQKQPVVAAHPLAQNNGVDSWVKNQINSSSDKKCKKKGRGWVTSYPPPPFFIYSHINEA